MHSMLQDIRFAARQLRKNPAFALTTILTLAVGIGATTAIFSLVNTVLLRPLPVPEPEGLASLQLAAQRPGSTPLPSSVSYPDFFDWREQNRCFSAIASIRNNSLTLTGAGEPQQLQAKTVSADFFRVLGVEPALGRGFVREEENPGTHVAVLSHELWQSTFGEARDVIGRSITLDGIAYTVVGVMPGGFEFPIERPRVLVWTTLADDAISDSPKDKPATAQRGEDMLEVVGRLKPGVSLAQGRADIDLISRNIAARYPDTNKSLAGAIVVPELDELVSTSRPALRLLFAAVILVLLIACANVAGLLLARASRRRQEMAVRSALGATRIQVVRQLLVESVLLSLLSGGFGVALSVGLLRIFLRLVPQNLPRLDQVKVDGAVLLFALLASVFTGLLFGVLPAWRISRLDPTQALHEGARSVTSGRGQHRLHSALVVLETAIGLMLLAGSGLLIHSFVHVLQVDPGFNPQHLLTAGLTLPDNQYPALKKVDFYNRLLERLASLPGVQSAAAANPLPLTTSSFIISFSIQGQTYPTGEEPSEFLNIVTPGFFRTMQIPILEGRDFDERDDSRSAPVMIVNEAFVRKYFPGQNPLGQHIKVSVGDGVTRSPQREVVGVVGNTKRHKLTSDIRAEYFLPFAQAIITNPRLLLRTTGDPLSLIRPLHAQLAAMDKNIPLFKVQAFDDLVLASAAAARFQTLLVTGFAAIALALSAIGLYAVLSYTVAQRTLEIGLRIALGAQRSDILRLILRRGLALAVIGLGIGIFASLTLNRFMAGLLYEVRPFDPLTLLAVSAVLLAVALVASSAPALRAARLDPMTTLRQQ